MDKQMAIAAGATNTAATGGHSPGVASTNKSTAIRNAAAPATQAIASAAIATVPSGGCSKVLSDRHALGYTGWVNGGA